MIDRRQLLALLASLPASGSGLSFDAALEGRRGAVALLDLKTNRLSGSSRLEAAATREAKPGSTLKPLTLMALLQCGKLRPSERFVCPRKLRLLGRHLDCSHVPTSEAFDVVTALAYSCNCFVAHFAARFETGELANRLREFGLGSRPRFTSQEAAGSVTALGGEHQQTQALGEEGVVVTPLTLLAAYRELARYSTGRTHQTRPVFEGLEAAVDSGTAQLARVPGLQIAGKTGTATTHVMGQRLAWFAGYAPADKPATAIVVLVDQGSGGADAAPVAASALKAWQSASR